MFCLIVVVLVIAYTLITLISCAKTLKFKVTAMFVNNVLKLPSVHLYTVMKGRQPALEVNRCYSKTA